MNRLRTATLCALAFSVEPVLPAGATRFFDVRNTLDANTASVVEERRIDILSTPTQLEIGISRPESLPDDGEIAVYSQWATVTYDITPPPDIEDRSEWYTRFVWTDLAGVSVITIRTTTQASCVADIQGLSTDLTRLPGAYYTAFTPTIQYVSGIDETIRNLERTMDDVSGYPGGDVGLAQRWAAFLRGTFSAGTCHPGGGIDDAAGTWAAGIADCDGFANMFASGMRSLGIPACVMIGFAMEGGPVFDDYALMRLARGLHGWAGAWSEGLQAFVPLDISIHEFGLVDAQRIHFAYHEDLTNDSGFYQLPDGSIAIHAPSYPSFQQSNSGTLYVRSRDRYADDGFGIPFVTNEVLGLHAPGGITGAPEPDSAGAEEIQLIVSSPFRSSLTVSLQARAPSTVTLEIFDALGRRVAVPAESRPIGPGESFFRWLPETAASGIYFVRATSSHGVTRTGRAVLIR